MLIFLSIDGVISIIKYSFHFNIVLFCSYNGLQKVGNTAENCKWYNFCSDLGVTPRILFTQNRISIENSK